MAFFLWFVQEACVAWDGHASTMVVDPPPPIPPFLGEKLHANGPQSINGNACVHCEWNELTSLAPSFVSSVRGCSRCTVTVS